MTEGSSLGAISIQWNGATLSLLDQRLLPSQEVWLEYHDYESVVVAIKDMVVRGAPAIGITAAYACVLAAKTFSDESSHEKFVGALDLIASARPTAVNLMWAVDSVRALTAEHSPADLPVAVKALAELIHHEDVQANLTMADYAMEALAGADEPFSVITHCNAGSIATGGYGTALGVVRRAWERGLIDRVYADETRPWWQGSRLTVWELQKENIPVTLNSDASAAWLLANKNVKWAIVGADRIAANGDVANKIGTYGLAILAKFHGVKVMVAAPTSTIDVHTSSGDEITIEMRGAEELTEAYGTRIAPEHCEVINPVFDVTPNQLIDAIVTEKGLMLPPFSDAIAALMD